MSSPSQITRPFIMAAIVMAVAFAVYYYALGCGFVYDDIQQVLENPWITDTRFLNDIFSSNVWGFRRAPSNYYRPMMLVVYMLDYHIFGLNAWGYHLTNVLFHAGNSALVFFLASRLIARPGASKSLGNISAPFFAAIFFAVHPIHTESVTWVAGLPDVSFTFFYLLSFYLYIVPDDGGRHKGFSIASVAAFFLASLCKEPALTLPVLLVAYDYSYRKERVYSTRNLKRYIPYLVVAFAYFMMRVNALGGFSPENSKLAVSNQAANVSLLFFRYLEKLLFPINLNVLPLFHPARSIFTFVGALSLLVSAGFMYLLFLTAKRNRATFLGLMFIAVPLLPALYILTFGLGFTGAFAERYLYVSVFGLAVLLALPVEWARDRVPQGVTVFTALALSVAALYSIGTISRNTIWKDGMNLWTDTIKKSPDNAIGHTHLGIAYNNEGMEDKAIEEFLTAIRLNPNSPEAHNNLGLVYNDIGRMDKAIEEFLTVIRLNPDFPEAHNNLGFVYNVKGWVDKAIEEFQTAIRLNPDFPKAHINLGLAYNRTGLVDKAIEQFQIATRINPYYPDALNYLGLAYASKGRMDEAIEQFRIAAKIDQHSPEAYNNLGVAYASKGSVDWAIEQFQTAARVAPNSPDAYYNLGVAYNNKGLTDKAVEQLETAVRLDPANAEVRVYLADVLKEARRQGL